MAGGDAGLWAASGGDGCPRTILTLMRMSIFATFLGHATTWLFDSWADNAVARAMGVGRSCARLVVPLVCLMELAIACSALMRPCSLVVSWAVVWAFCLAVTELVADRGVGAYLQRSTAWALPAVLLWLQTRDESVDYCHASASVVLHAMPAWSVARSLPWTGFTQLMALELAAVLAISALVTITGCCSGGAPDRSDAAAWRAAQSKPPGGSKAEETKKRS